MSEIKLSEKFPIAKLLDARNVRCPLPLLRAKQALLTLALGDVLEVLATDPGACRDIPAWCQLAGQLLVQHEQRANGEFCFLIQRLK